jgi:hypothetical protein
LLSAQVIQFYTPDAPLMDIQWSAGYTITLYDPPGSNNYGQQYTEYIVGLGGLDPYWHFQGYLLYQHIDGDFVPWDIYDPTRAVLIGQSDIADGVGALSGVVHWHVTDTSGTVLLDTCIVETVNGADAGLQFTYTATHDAFTGLPFTAIDTACFVAVAYAYQPDWYDTDCSAADPILISNRSPLGAIQAVCVTPQALAVNDMLQDDTWSIGPNPVEQALTITAAGAPLEVRVFNALGAMMPLIVATGERMQVDVSDYPAGWYALRIKDAEGATRTQRFLVLR